MKKIIFILAFTLIGSFAFAKTGEIKEPNKVVSECCTATVTNESTGDTSTVRCCRTTMAEACDAAYARAKKAVLDDI